MVNKYVVELESTSALLMDRYSTVKPPKKGDDAGYRKQAEDKVYRDADGVIAIPSSALKAAMRECAYRTAGFGKRTDERLSVISGVFMEEEYLSLNRKDHDGIDERHITRGKPPKVTRVLSFRPRINKWNTKVTIITTDMDAERLRQLLDLAGTMSGLLSYRPEFGRFRVVKFTQLKE